MYETNRNPDRTIIISVIPKGTNRTSNEDNLKELKLLCKTAGCNVVLQLTQELPKINNATCVGTGKLEEIKEIIKDEDIQLIVFDDELSPMQNRNLMRELNIKVMDRSGIILEIFATHARSQEARLQVELAYLQYMLPRLTRQWTHLSKQYGGVGTNAKGPGETQIESDRRLVRERIQFLKGKLKEIEIQKNTQRKGREDLTRFALVGYTNAGKSTLMKAIMESNSDEEKGENIYIADKLFATLDTTVRSFELPSGEKSLLSDTVGFIRKLPHHLVASFRSTLAEAKEADFIVIVTDISHPNFEDHIKVVNDTLLGLGIIDKTFIHIFNKIDLLEEKDIISRLKKEYTNPIFISAKHRSYIDDVLNKFAVLNDALTKKIDLFVPYPKMNMLNKIYNNAEIISRTDTDTGVALRLKIKKDYSIMFHNLYKEFLSNKQ